jgi:hypothetical protein
MPKAKLSRPRVKKRKRTTGEDSFPDWLLFAFKIAALIAFLGSVWLEHALKAKDAPKPLLPPSPVETVFLFSDPQGLSEPSEFNTGNLL